MKQRSSIQTLTLVGVLSALTYAATYALHVPVPGGVFHLGDGVVFLAAILFGWKEAALSGAIGMALFDLFSPWIAYAPFTFVIKGIMGMATGMVAWSGGHRGHNSKRNVYGVVFGGGLMVIGYYLTKAYMLGGDFISPLATAVPYDILQVVGGAIVGLPIAKALKRTRYFGG